jgi:hypothetical protein
MDWQVDYSKETSEAAKEGADDVAAVAGGVGILQNAGAWVAEENRRGAKGMEAGIRQGFMILSVKLAGR